MDYLIILHLLRLFIISYLHNNVTSVVTIQWAYLYKPVTCNSRNMRNIPSIPCCGCNFRSLLIIRSVIDKVATPCQPRSQETISLILPFLHLADNFYLLYRNISAAAFASKPIDYAWLSARERERKFLRGSHFLAWVSWYSENVAQVKKMATWWYARVWDSPSIVAISWNGVHAARERDHERTAVSGNHHFERCCILQTVQPTQTHGRRRKHHRNHPRPNPIGRGVLIHGIPHHPRTQTHCQVCRERPWILRR